MSYSKVVPISIIEKYLDNPGELTVYSEYYKDNFLKNKECIDIDNDIRNILTNYNSDDDDDYYYHDEFIPISIIKNKLDKSDYSLYDATPEVLINNIKNILRPEYVCSYCGETNDCDYSIDCNYFKYDGYSKLKANEHLKKQIEENHSGFGHIACADLFCSFYCADKHYEVVHFQDKTTNDLRCSICKSRYNILSCRCYHRNPINVESESEFYQKTIFCEDCINCDKCKPETCNINAALGTEDVFSHAYRTNNKYKPNGELKTKDEKKNCE